MSNSYYNFTTLFIAGTTVKAAPLNSQFSAIQTGFATVQTALDRSVKITGLTNGGEVTKTANTFLLLNASGNPTSSATLSFAPNMGGYKITNLADGSASTDACSYGQMTAHVATIAFGSPNVLTVPAFPGNGLQPLRLNVGETELEFGSHSPFAPLENGRIAISQGGEWAVALQGKNLLPNSDSLDDHWTLATGISIGRPSGLATALWGATNPSMTHGVGVDLIKLEAGTVFLNAGQTVSASCQVCMNSTDASALSLFLRFFNSSNVQIGVDSVQSFAGANPGTDTLYHLYATAPATTQYVVVGVKTTSATTTTNGYVIGRFQLEYGAISTSWDDSANWMTMATYRSLVDHRDTGTHGIASVIGVGDNVTDASVLFDTSASSSYSAALKATATGSATNGGGDITWEHRRMRFGNAVGFASVYGNGTMGATKTVNWYNGQKQSGTLDQNCTITLTAPDNDIVMDGLRLRLTFGGAGGWTVTFTSTATIRWVGNISPTSANGMITTAGQELECVFDWDGTRFVGRWANL